MSNCTCADCLSRQAKRDPQEELRALIDAAIAKSDEMEKSGRLTWCWRVGELLAEALVECDEIEVRDPANDVLEWHENWRFEDRRTA